MYVRPPQCKCKRPFLLPWYDNDRICLCGAVWYARRPMTIEEAQKDRRKREGRLTGSGRDYGADA